MSVASVGFIKAPQMITPPAVVGQVLKVLETLAGCLPDFSGVLPELRSA